MDATQPNMLEQLRAERIRQNHAALAALGLEPAQPTSGQKKKLERAPSSCRAQPMRQSARLRHSSPEVQPSSTAKIRVPVLRKMPAPRCVEEQQEYESALHAHNSYRITTMSDKALETRVRRITNVEKLRSFIQVLRCAQKAQLAQEAEDRLHHLMAGASSDNGTMPSAAMLT